MTPKEFRCATYARYSSDQQREASIVDQQRNMARYAESKNWRILPEFVFSDAAMSGAGADRPGLQALLSSALSRPKPFDIILMDDTSRISRNLGEIIRIREQLNFAGVRLVAVSQGIDSADEQADVMLTVHGLVDSLYLKELAKKTHRGLEGLAMDGFHTGGNCFGYRNTRVGQKVRLEIDEEEAVVVRRIFELSANGKSLKQIAKLLNAEGVPPPRGSKRKVKPSWVYTAIRQMLRRELYIGRVIWNKRKFVKKPGTNKRISVLRPEKEWVISEDASLRIISQQLWTAVQAQLKIRADQYAAGKPGLMNRGASSPYLFSGILKCAECGSNLTLVMARGKDRKIGYYGCPGHLNRAICNNDVYQRRDLIEEILLHGLRTQLLDSASIDYILCEVKKGSTEEEAQEQIASLNRKSGQIRLELDRLAEAIAKSGGSDFLLEALRKKESELKNIERSAASMSRLIIPVDLKWLRKRIIESIEALPTLLQLDAERAKSHLLKHVTEIRMHPTKENGKKFYVAEGEWFMPENESATGALLDGGGRMLRSIAGAGFEPATFGL
jgi:site-specific DNA recombinase